MSQPAVKALDLPFELVYSDGIPLESALHRGQMDLLLDVILQAMAARGREDFYAGGDMFVYYSPEQAWEVYEGRYPFRGPDVFFVDGAEPKGARKVWAPWEENGRLPDLIVEILSKSTEKIDRVDKMKLYSRVFRTREYFLYDLESAKLDGYRLAGDLYQRIRPGKEGRLRSEVLGLDFGIWQGTVGQSTGTWARLYHPDGSLAPTPAEAERRRAEIAEAEVARLRALLRERKDRR
jgi:Uma2 family endonuclease